MIFVISFITFEVNIVAEQKQAYRFRGFPEGRPVFSPPMGAYFRLAFIWC